MHPDYIDYALIDSPIRELVKAINKSSWIKTIGSCAGRAYHTKYNFYLFVEVRGVRGIRNLLKWLSLSHTLGFKAYYETRSIKDYAVTEAELFIPNLRNKEHFVSKTAMGPGWFKIAIRLRLGVKLPNKVQTEGGIKALELGWNGIIEQSYQRRKKKELSFVT